uniref:FAD binding domain-containing protein n=1 Tax=Nonomuraea bangladeshensis TaxID=404385 RepID=UPI003F495DF9
MKPFTFDRAKDVDGALAALRNPHTKLIAGGTDFLNLLREGIERPEHVLDIGGLPLAGIEMDGDRMLVGALARMSDVESDPRVRRNFPVISESLMRSASAQLRNMATIGGNLLQRTRCAYFRADTELACNQRVPGSGCSALEGGETSSHAIFGWSGACAATHPSDLAVALAALDAVVVVTGPHGERRISATEFHRLPGDEPERITELQPDELIIAVEVPAGPAAHLSHYLKVRERVSYEFAVVSVAASLEVDNGTITRARLALGGVAARPWRLPEAETALQGIALTDAQALRSAIALSFTEARALPGNAFKVELSQRAAVRAVQNAGARS